MLEVSHRVLGELVRRIQSIPAETVLIRAIIQRSFTNHFGEL